MDEDIIVFLRGFEEEEDYESLKPDNEGMGRHQWGSRSEVRCHGPLGAELDDIGQQKEQKGQVLGWTRCLDCVLRIVILITTVT